MWKQLEKDLSSWLKHFESDKLHFRNPYQAIVGFPNQGFRSDGMLTDGKTLLAIEVEAGQMHPDTNVGKYWLLCERYHKYEKIILIHVFTPNFNSYGWRFELAKFCAEKMQEQQPLKYMLQDYRQTQDSYEHILFKLKKLLQNQIEIAFPETEEL
ncbi:MAG: hypothetical protein KC445_18485 [Anaerolineales bacterium]|nr:hypothetical protein [Anaerolineales bacterium]